MTCQSDKKKSSSRPLLCVSRRDVCSYAGKVRIIRAIFLFVNHSLRGFDRPRVEPLLEADMAIGEAEDTGAAVSAGRYTLPKSAVIAPWEERQKFPVGDGVLEFVHEHESNRSGLGRAVMPHNGIYREAPVRNFCASLFQPFTFAADPLVLSVSQPAPPPEALSWLGFACEEGTLGLSKKRCARRSEGFCRQKPRGSHV